MTDSLIREWDSTNHINKWNLDLIQYSGVVVWYPKSTTIPILAITQLDTNLKMLLN